MATTERNAQGVDVLAVMATTVSHVVIDSEGMQSEYQDECATEALRSKLIEARVAVAELVEAINEYRDTATATRAALPGRIELTMNAHESATTRLRAALAKFPEPRP